MKKESSPLPGKLMIIPGIAATFIGTVVGAGFASGQEIYQFFGKYEFWGIAGIVLAVLLMGSAGVKVFYFGAILKPQSYQELLFYLLGPKFGKLIDLIFLLFFIILIGVMFAGCGTIFETANLGYWPGVIFTGVIVMFVLLKGLPGLISANLLIVPLMFIGCLGLSIFAIRTGDIANAGGSINNVYGFKWLLASLQFSAYNLVLAFPVLLSLGRRYPYKKRLISGSWLGSLALGVMAGFIHWSVMIHPLLSKNALPMVILAKNIGSWAYLSYAVVLWGEMFSTLLANCFGVALRLVSFTGWSYPIWVLILNLTGMVIAEIGFVNLIANFYPIYGYVCFIVLVVLFLKPLPVKQGSSSRLHGKDTILPKEINESRHARKSPAKK